MVARIEPWFLMKAAAWAFFTSDNPMPMIALALHVLSDRNASGDFSYPSSARSSGSLVLDPVKS